MSLNSWRKKSSLLKMNLHNTLPVSVNNILLFFTVVLELCNDVDQYYLIFFCDGIGRIHKTLFAIEIYFNNMRAHYFISSYLVF